MHRPASTPSLALCAAALPAGMATCASLEPLQDLDGWKLLMPAGAFKPNDGRQGWTNPNSEAVIAASKLPALIDIDHGTQTRGDSKAAAWIEEMKPHGPNGEPGIWGRVEGTPAGKAALAAKDYRFFSPTFLHDAARVVTKIVGGSLVNNPALDDIPALASTQETTLDEFLDKLRQALGLPDTATADDVLAAIAALNQNVTATASQVQLLATASGIALGAGARLSTDQVTAICARLKTGGGTADVERLQGEVDKLQMQVATLSSTQAATTAAQEVDAAIKAGKLTPAQKEWGLSYCSRDPKGFQEFVGKAPVIIEGGRDAPAGAVEGALTTEEVAMCSTLGISQDDYKATAKARKEGK
jgi:phage I-like protein